MNKNIVYSVCYNQLACCASLTITISTDIKFIKSVKLQVIFVQSTLECLSGMKLRFLPVHLESHVGNL